MIIVPIGAARIAEQAATLINTYVTGTNLCGRNIVGYKSSRGICRIGTSRTKRTHTPFIACSCRQSCCHAAIGIGCETRPSAGSSAFVAHFVAAYPCNGCPRQIGCQSGGSSAQCCWHGATCCCCGTIVGSPTSGCRGTVGAKLHENSTAVGYYCSGRCT